MRCCHSPLQFAPVQWWVVNCRRSHRCMTLPGWGAYEAGFVAPEALSGLNWGDALAIGINVHLSVLITSLLVAGICQARSPSRRTEVTVR